MELLQTALIIAYLLVTSYFFINWLKFFNRTPSSSVEDRFLSVVVLIIATILWPFIIPISYLELFKAGQSQFKVMPVVLAIFLISLLLYLG